MSDSTPLPIRVMGILNVTPDSFSDGGQFMDAQHAIDRGLQMAAEGAAIIDLGAESTRPGSTGVSSAEQLARLLPVLRGLRTKTDASIGIDTRSADVAETCLAEGADVINDVSALRHDPRMIQVLGKCSRAEIVLMHMLGTPESMQKHPTYVNVVDEIRNFFSERVAFCKRGGIAQNRIWLDPGFGFGKTFAHNLEIVRRFQEFSALKLPLAAGVSRKSFLGRLTGEADAARRDVASIAAGLELAKRGAAILRVHNVAGHVAALKVYEAFNP